jgi:hypothetical protein
MRFHSFIITLLASIPGQAQHLRYKDIFPQLPQMTNQEIKNTLKEYILTDLDHPNANFRLALAYEKSYKTADPLTNTEYVLANAAQAKLRFFKAKQLVDEREVNRNNDYYFQTFKIADSKGKPDVPFAVVLRKITNGFDSANLFIDKIPAIHKHFSKSVNFYDKAVKTFAAINSSFLTLNDLYMDCNETTLGQLNDLQNFYDSATSSFDRYLVLVSEFPVTQHRQKYGVKPIVTYRLDGLLTNLNFLTNKVELWDYASWAKQIKSFVNTEVQSLRKRLVDEEEKLDKSLALIDQSTGEGIIPVKVDKQLTYNLNNYDRQSLVLALFNYKAFKQQWLLKTKVFTPDTTVSYRNAENYSAFIYLNRSADTLLNSVKTRLTLEKIHKHNDFLLKYYGNQNGIETYHSKEKELIGDKFKDYTSHLRSEIIGLMSPPTIESKSLSDKIIRLGKWTVPTVVSTINQELIDKGDPITLRSIKNFDGGICLSGIYKADKKSSSLSSFVMRINPDGKAAWIKNFEYKIDTLSKMPDANNFIASIDLTKDGCALVVHTSGNLQAGHFNTFVYFNDKGEEKLRVKLKESSYPRQLSYIEKSNSFILVLKGSEEKNNYATSEPMTIIGINILGDITWKRSVDLAGVFTEMINLVDGNMVIGSFMIIKDLNNREHRTKISSFESNPYIIKFDNQGDLQNIIPVSVPRSVRIIKVLKVNDNSINLIGKEETLDSTGANTISADGKFVHVMINQYGQTIYSNL